MAPDCRYGIGFQKVFLRNEKYVATNSEERPITVPPVFYQFFKGIGDDPDGYNPNALDNDVEFEERTVCLAQRSHVTMSHFANVLMETNSNITPKSPALLTWYGFGRERVEAQVKDNRSRLSGGEEKFIPLQEVVDSVSRDEPFAVRFADDRHNDRYVLQIYELGHRGEGRSGDPLSVADANTFRETWKSR
tara:strand:- start:3648 stop:4220 length:573 start_codon:yes stop_codon:yes gene_type:complete